MVINIILKKYQKKKRSARRGKTISTEDYLNWTGKQAASKWEKEYIKPVYYHPAYLTYMQSTS